MLSKEFAVNCKEGFHLRPAQVLVEKVTPFESSITIKKSEDEEADAKSILGMMSLGIEKGQTVVVEVNGADEDQTMNAVEELFKNNFDE
jgi:phosphotransferase system HPr (HPr) family protein